jgi:hypothetical protein
MEPVASDPVHRSSPSSSLHRRGEPPCRAFPSSSWCHGTSLTSRSVCRSAPDPSPPPASPLHAGPLPCAGELHPPHRRAALVQVGPLDVARRLHLASVSLEVKTSPTSGHRRTADGRTKPCHMRAVAMPRCVSTVLWPRVGQCILGQAVLGVGYVAVWRWAMGHSSGQATAPVASAARLGHQAGFGPLH